MDDIRHRFWNALVIANDARMQYYLSTILLDAGIKTTCTRPNIEVAEALAQQHFDLLLIDSNAFDLSTLSICETARLLYGNSIVIIAVMNKSFIWQSINALYLGADDCVSSDCHAQELLARIYTRMRRMSAAVPAFGHLQDESTLNM